MIRWANSEEHGVESGELLLRFQMIVDRRLGELLHLGTLRFLCRHVAELNCGHVGHCNPGDEVEVSSGLIILWQFSHRLPESRERQALRLMAFSFFALAAYVAVESVRALFFGGAPDSSPVGIGLAVASLVVMPFLSWAQRRTGRALGSNAVVADSTQTLLCTYLSAVLLVGLLLNATLGWGWADPIAGLIIAAVAVREGVEAWKGEGCACGPVIPGESGDDGCGCAAGCTDACCTPAATAAEPQTLQITPREHMP